MMGTWSAGSAVCTRLARWPPRCPSLRLTGEVASKMSQFVPDWRGGLQDVPVCPDWRTGNYTTKSIQVFQVFCPPGEVASKMSQFLPDWRGGLQDVPVCPDWRGGLQDVPVFCPTGEVASKMSQVLPDWRDGLQDVPVYARLARWPPRCPSLCAAGLREEYAPEGDPQRLNSAEKSMLQKVIRNG
jgi:hypothetical protein